MLRARMIKIGKLVKRQLAIALRPADQILLRTTICRKLIELFHPRVNSGSGVAVAHATAAGELLNAGVNHATPEAVLEALMEVAHFPELFPNPAVLNSLLERAQ